MEECEVENVEQNGEAECWPNGLPKNYNTMVRPGVPDGSDPSNPVRVYADGVFDMYHIGHAKVLEQAKKIFKHVHLIVGVSPDWEVNEKKGKLVNNETERVEIIKHCKWVDEVLFPCPWKLTVPFLIKHNIHYVAHDDLPYGAAGEEDIYYEVKKCGMFRATQRTDGISTSDVILRIIKDYDMYVDRSLQRGYKRKDIGISATKELRLKLKKIVNDYKTKILGKDGFKTSGQAGVWLTDMFHNLEFTTEKLWQDFVGQYQTAGVRRAEEIKNKNERQAQLMKQEAQVESSPEEQQEEKSSVDQNSEQVEDHRNWWERTWQFIKEQFDLDQEADAIKSSSEAESQDIEDIEQYFTLFPAPEENGEEQGEENEVEQQEELVKPSFDRANSLRSSSKRRKDSPQYTQ